MSIIRRQLFYVGASVRGRYFSTPDNIEKLLVSQAKFEASKGTAQASQAKPLRLYEKVSFRRTFRFFRMVGLMGTFGASMYAMGQIDYIDDPESFENKVMKSLLLQLGISQYVLASENDRISKLSVVNVKDDALSSLVPGSDLHQAAILTQKIFRRLKIAAIAELEAQISDLESKLGEKKDSEDTGRAGLIVDYGNRNVDDFAAGSIAMNLKMEELELAKQKRKSLDQRWDLIVFQSPIPNAFLNGFLPDKVFVSTALLREFTDDESQLALVMAHELSHYLLGHTKHMLMLDAIIKVAVVGVISLIDITGGLGSFLFEVSVPYFGSLISASFSRDQEAQADAFGLKLTTRACYDPDRAIQLFGNMEKYMERASKTSILGKLNVAVSNSMMSTHPVNASRLEQGRKRLPEQEKLYLEYGCKDGVFSRAYKSLATSIWTPSSAVASEAGSTKNAASVSQPKSELSASDEGTKTVNSQ